MSNAVLDQFLSESREFLQAIGENLLTLECRPDDQALIGELFRHVHTLKGNCGLFDFPDMLRAIHAAEDVMTDVREGILGYSRELADALLEAMDYVAMLVDEIEQTGAISVGHGARSVELAQLLRALRPATAQGGDAGASTLNSGMDPAVVRDWIARAPEELRQDWVKRLLAGASLSLVAYRPEAECFFKGEDPLHLMRQIPQSLWGEVQAADTWPAMQELDIYQCNLRFVAVSDAAQEVVREHFRYVPEQVGIASLAPWQLIVPQGGLNGGPVYEDFVTEALQQLDRGDHGALRIAARTMLELSAPQLWMCSVLRWLLCLLESDPDVDALRALVDSLRTMQVPQMQDVALATAGAASAAAAEAADAAPNALAGQIRDALIPVLRAQQAVLGFGFSHGRVQAVGASLRGCLAWAGHPALGLERALAEDLANASCSATSAWLAAYVAELASGEPAAVVDAAERELPPCKAVQAAARQTPSAEMAAQVKPSPDHAGNNARDTGGAEIKFGRRAEDAPGMPKTVKVEQGKIDRLMNLIGEMVVAKNGLPYLAGRAEQLYGVRDLSREIKTQYSVINRIAEEMQDAIMQVRMMPVSFIFQRFPRLVRDITRRLGKEVDLVLEGEDTEADKNIIEALADPLIHIVRNSLDHGIELPQARQEAGKPACGRLVIRASQESDRVVIEIADDGKGIDPGVVKRKAYEKGLIDEAALDRLCDQEAVNLVFLPGFSTAETVSDLSGRGVGMDVVRAAVEKVNGTVHLSSVRGQGTRIQLSLPLSMAVTNVMIIESDDHIYGVPMDMVVETVRVPRANIHTIKNRQATVLRGRIVPLRSLNELLASNQPQRINEDEELATLVLRVNDEHVGVIVDDFREVVDIILKPMTGILGGIPGYSGSALLGDGSVLMVLNPKELV